MTGILIFHGAVGYRHESTAAGVHAVRELGADNGVTTFDTADSRVFESSDLDGFEAVVWMQNSGTGILDVAQRLAYERYTAAGGGFAGVHAASDGERDWPLYDQLIGGRFRAHPAELQPARLRVEQPDPSTVAIRNDWDWTDEWYSFDDNPRPRVVVLATVSESDYDPGETAMGDDHPVVWRTQVGPARAWYTALGHQVEAFDDPIFRAHLWGGITSVLRIPTRH
jgi:type 1 glutamine amidotransferase